MQGMPDHIPSAHSCFFCSSSSSFFFSDSDYFSVPPPPFHPIPSHPARPIQLILSPSKYESAKINLSCFGIKPAVPFVRGGKGRFSFFFFFFFKRTTAPSAKPPPVSSPSLFVSPRPWRRCCLVSFCHLSPLPCFPDARMRARVYVCVQLRVPSCRYCRRRCCVAETSRLLFLQVAARRGPASPCVYSCLGLLPPDDKERLMNK